MRLKLVRYKSNKQSTLGKLFIDGDFECYTVEDAYHEAKIHGKTRIPSGTYRVFLRRMGTSRFDLKYTTKFKHLGDNWYAGMLQLEGVPGFVGVEIHIGNSAKDTDGCILVGESTDDDPDENGSFTIMKSTSAFEHLYPQVRDALQAGKKVDIEILDDSVLTS